MRTWVGSIWYVEDFLLIWIALLWLVSSGILMFAGAALEPFVTIGTEVASPNAKIREPVNCETYVLIRINAYGVNGQ